MKQQLESPLQINDNLTTVLADIDRRFPPDDLLGRLGERPDNEDKIALELAVNALNAGAQEPLIPATRLISTYLHIAERIGCLPVSNPKVLIQQVGRLAVRKPVVTTTTPFHPAHYDELTYGYKTKKQRESTDMLLAGILREPPQFTFALARATAPRVHALTMNVCLTMLSESGFIVTHDLLPAHVAALAIGQAAIRSHRDSLQDMHKLDSVADRLQMLNLLLASLGKTRVSTTGIMKVIEEEKEQREAVIAARQPTAPPRNRRHSQAITAGQQRRKL